MLDRERYWDCLDQAMEASSNGQPDAPLAWLNEALKANPERAEAHNSRGELFWDSGRHEEALQEFERALEAEADYQPSQLNRIEILIEEFQEFEEALDLADDLLQSALEKPVEAEVYYLKAKTLFYLDDLVGALFLLRRAIKIQGEGRRGRRADRGVAQARCARRQRAGPRGELQFRFRFASGASERQWPDQGRRSQTG